MSEMLVGRNAALRSRVMAVMLALGALLALLAGLDPGTLRGGGWQQAYWTWTVVIAACAVLTAAAGARVGPRACALLLLTLDIVINLTVLANQSRDGAHLNVVLLLGPTAFAAVFLDRWQCRAQEFALVGSCILIMAVDAPAPVTLASLIVMPSVTLVFATELIMGLRIRLSSVLEAVRAESFSDPLTGLLNRRGLQHELRAHRAPVSVLLLDVDHFKAVNDRLGHDVGDQVLQVLAAAVRAEVRHDDLVVRWGGEEIAVILTHGAADDGALLADRIRIGCRRALADQGVTVSIGVATHDAPATSPDLRTLIRHADAALYRAKNGGRDRVEVEVVTVQV